MCVSVEESVPYVACTHILHDWSEPYAHVTYSYRVCYLEKSVGSQYTCECTLCAVRRTNSGVLLNSFLVSSIPLKLTMWATHGKIEGKCISCLDLNKHEIWTECWCWLKRGGTMQSPQHSVWMMWQKEDDDLHIKMKRFISMPKPMHLRNTIK